MCLYSTKNYLIPLLILFKICGIVRLCILYKLPEGTPRSQHLAQAIKINRGFARTQLFAYAQASTWVSISDAVAGWR
jgi:hypothetical protein